MEYRIDTAYVWLETHEDTQVVLMYFINNIPFTFDEFPELARSNPEAIQEGLIEIKCMTWNNFIDHHLI